MTEMCYQQLLCELESHQLVTILAPSKRRDRRETDQIRVNMDVPPTWYRRLCHKYPSSRGTRRGKHDTVIRRANILSTLRVLADGRHTWSKYAPELRRIAAGVR